MPRLSVLPRYLVNDLTGQSSAMSLHLKTLELRDTK